MWKRLSSNGLPAMSKISRLSKRTKMCISRAMKRSKSDKLSWSIWTKIWSWSIKKRAISCKRRSKRSEKSSMPKRRSFKDTRKLSRRSTRRFKYLKVSRKALSKKWTSWNRKWDYSRSSFRRKRRWIVNWFASYSHSWTIRRIGPLILRIKNRVVMSGRSLKYMLLTPKRAAYLWQIQYKWVVQLGQTVLTIGVSL